MAERWCSTRHRGGEHAISRCRAYTGAAVEHTNAHCHALRNPVNKRDDVHDACANNDTNADAERISDTLIHPERFRNVVVICKPDPEPVTISGRRYNTDSVSVVYANCNHDNNNDCNTDAGLHHGDADVPAAGAVLSGHPCNPSRWR